MRKNVKQQLALRVLSTAALMAMVCSSIATAAFAAEYNVKDGRCGEMMAKDGVQSITQWADKDEGTYVTDDKGAIERPRRFQNHPDHQKQRHRRDRDHFQHRHHYRRK